MPAGRPLDAASQERQQFPRVVQGPGEGRAGEFVRDQFQEAVDAFLGRRVGAQQGGVRQVAAGEHHLLPEAALLALQLVQGRGETHRVPGELGGGAVGFELAVARQGELGEGAQGRRRQQHQQGQQRRGGETQEQGRDTEDQQHLAHQRQQAGDAAQGVGEGHHLDIAVGDVGELVGEDADELPPLQTPQEAIRQDDGRVLAPPGGEGVHHPARQVVEPWRLLQPGARRQPLQEPVEAWHLPGRQGYGAVEPDQEPGRGHRVDHPEHRDAQQGAPQKGLAAHHPGQIAEQQGQQPEQPELLQAVAHLVFEQALSVHGG